ncbi:hypothetical protein BP6252_03908 [Coleophoma cylindrospora]|uniref:Uncharacterized protein n=1 Tax=Coleophoma cylindrospora TaxID=1849047 RepID=A0A3D8S8W6_9HELO|nr:hypothetical protein BP6252_03908 [Coleophoma cylindrospora]
MEFDALIRAGSPRIDVASASYIDATRQAGGNDLAFKVHARLSGTHTRHAINIATCPKPLNPSKELEVEGSCEEVCFLVLVAPDAPCSKKDALQLGGASQG